MNTPVYVKMDSPEPLLLAEGVCRQLKIISYHPDVTTGNSQRRTDGKVWNKQDIQVAPATATSSAAAKVDSFCNANHSATHHSQSKEPQPTQLLPREPQLRDSQRLGHVGTSPTKKPDVQVQVPALAGGRGRETGATGYTILPHQAGISRPDRDGAGGAMEPGGTGESVRKGIAERAKDPPGQLEIPDQPDTIDGATQTDSLHRPESTETTVTRPPMDLDMVFVPTVRVWLSRTVRVPANQNVMVPVRVDGGTPPDSAVLLEGDEEMEAATGVKVVDALLGRIEGGETQLLLSNLSGFTQKLEGGTYLGRAAEVQVVTSEDNETLSSPAAITTHDIEPITTHDIESETDAGYAETVQLSSGHIFHITEGGGTYLGRVTGEDTSEEEDVPTATIPPVTTCPEDEMVPLGSGHVFRVTDELRRECRRKKLLQILQEPDLPPEEKKQLMEFLADNHEAFSLEGERGETDLVEMVIDTGDARPLKQAPRRMPYSVRQEVARQLKEMQHGGVIEPSKSAWASPVVLVRKRDGSHRFCVDYRRLNSLTKADTFPLPRIDELLDQLGKARYFSTIDLASGFWQIKVHPDSQEKTAFVTPQGLLNFKVMPFGLTNAPAV